MGSIPNVSIFISLLKWTLHRWNSPKFHLSLSLKNGKRKSLPNEAKKLYWEWKQRRQSWPQLPADAPTAPPPVIIGKGTRVHPDVIIIITTTTINGCTALRWALWFILFLNPEHSR
jgi:hypothetical protein